MKFKKSMNITLNDLINKQYVPSKKQSEYGYETYNNGKYMLILKPTSGINFDLAAGIVMTRAMKHYEKYVGGKYEN